MIARANRPLVPAERTRDIRYALRDILGLADEVARGGREMLYLNIGDPNIYDFRPPLHILEATFDAMKRNKLGYAPSSGIPDALDAIRAEAGRKGIRSINHAYITTGCSEAIDLALSALVNAGDNVLTPSPGYPLYGAVMSKLLAENRPYFLDEENDWQPDVADIAAKIDERTRAIVLINPNNPTGALYTREVLEQIVDLAIRNNIVIFSDEIYDKLLYDGRVHHSTAALSSDAKVVTFNGLSKAYVVPGFRIGWGIVSGPPEDMRDYCEAIRKMERARLSANHPEQYAIRPALEGTQAHLGPMMERMGRQRDLLVERLNAIPGVSCVKPGGAFYAFPKLDISIPDEDFCARLIRESGVVVVHGSGFGQRPGTKHCRIVYLPDEQTLDKACGHIARLVGQYRAR